MVKQISKESIKFLSPQSTEWCDLNPIIPEDVPEEEKEKIKADSEAAQTVLKDYLLTSLQMQNLMVLSGSGTSRGPIVNGPSMDDLWNNIEKLPDDKGQELERANIAAKINYSGENNIEEFLSQCEAFLQIYNDEEVRSFYTLSKGKILSLCSFEITKENLIAHTTFLHRLSRRRIRDARLKLFTTNYDLCFETAASIQGLIVIDGFSFTQPRRYDPRYFSYDIVRRPRTGEESGNYLEGVFQLYKLHGSVNWARTSGEQTIKIKDNPDPSEACLIYPAKGKYQQSYNQPYLELMAQYLSSLREPNTCLIVIGFGFNDEHLAEPLLSAVTTNPHLRLIIVDYNAQNNVNGGTASHYWTSLKDLAQKGYDIWFINSSFKDFANIIPDLKALTPAEQLLQSFRSLVGGQ